VRFRFPKTAVAAVLVILVLVLAPAWWLTLVGRALVRDDGPARADMALVLAGDYFGHRILKGADLVRQGYVPAVMVSGPAGMYGVHEDQLAIAFAVQKGCPRQWFIPAPNDAVSTETEAQTIVPELRRRGVHRYLLVTSNYHTARAARTFRAAQRKLGADLEIRVVAAPDEYFRPESWWRERQGRKQFFFEFTKTLASALGI
jgi:uncharacterized SAM-binding protein YcdF (DUF218 family)